MANSRRRRNKSRKEYAVVTPQRRLVLDIAECVHEVLWRWAGPEHCWPLFFDVDVTRWLASYRCASAPGALLGNITRRSLHTEIVFTNPATSVRIGGLLAVHLGLSHDRRHIETALFFRSAHGMGETRIDYLYESHAQRWPWMADVQKVSRRVRQEFRSACGWRPATVMLEVELTDSLALYNIVKAVKDIIQDFNIAVSPEGMRVIQMDSSHVAMVDLELRAEGFDRFEVARPFCIGVNSATLDEFLKMGAKKDTSVSLSMNDITDDTLHMVFTRHDGSRSSRCRIKLLEIESDLLGIPEGITNALMLTMPSSEFRDIIKGLAVVGDVFTVDAHEEQYVTLSTDGVKGSLDEDVRPLANRIAIEVAEPFKVKLAARYLVMFVACSGISADVALRVDNSNPSRLCYTVNRRKGGDMEEDVTLANLCFWLAPKLEEDTDSS